MLRHPFIAFWLGFAGAASAQGEIRTSFLMDHDPEIQVPAAVVVNSPALIPLWLEALARPEADMQRMSADAIARGHSLAMPGLQEAVPQLENLLTSAQSHPSARLAAARALPRLGSTP